MNCEETWNIETEIKRKNQGLYKRRKLDQKFTNTLRSVGRNITSMKWEHYKMERENK